MAPFWLSKHPVNPYNPVCNDYSKIFYLTLSNFFKEKSIVGARQTQIFFFFMGNNGFNCLEVRGPLGRKYQADKQEQSNAAARCILDLHSRIP